MSTLFIFHLDELPFLLMRLLMEQKIQIIHSTRRNRNLCLPPFPEYPIIIDDDRIDKFLFIRNFRTKKRPHPFKDGSTMLIEIILVFFQNRIDFTF